MDEVDHLLSSLEDHLRAATEKSTARDVESALDDAKTTVSELADAGQSQEDLAQDIDDLLDRLDEIGTDDIEQPEVEKHIDAARRAARRVRDR
ncbi:hypothetical protein SAMN05216226_10476 [Halovenus aranensis]|uniref:Uncharacterized protein n=1 Tax=Halovenus aranensis TaxID=890420 RepID=A0A1G8U631_9EURY|nr:hypothetical protein [Halovenus aranensis]SDJ49276.1 hypothetical protein SAMN05216226_10476 [Halovenus aranensis]